MSRADCEEPAHSSWPSGQCHSGTLCPTFPMEAEQLLFPYPTAELPPRAGHTASSTHPAQQIHPIYKAGLQEQFSTLQSTLAVPSQTH